MNEMKTAGRLGVAVGLLFAGFHAAWAALVAAGAAQRILDWVFWLHFLSNPYVVGPFSPARAAGLLAFTFAVGYVLGFALSLLWPAAGESPAR